MNTEKNHEEPRAGLLARMLNALALGVITLSILLQSISFYIVFKNGTEGVDADTSYLFGSFSMVIFPGMILAFFKLLLNIIRSFKDAKARFKAALYFVITAWPLIGILLVSFSSVRAMSGLAAQDEARSTQFIAGHDWAKDKMPTMNSECQGSHEFKRGCWSYIKEFRDDQFLLGREWAKSNLPSKASQCKGTISFIKGCRNYYSERLEKPKPAGQGWYEGMTTAECKIEVNANFEALTQDFLENGNQHGAEVTRYRSWDPALKDCENYDKLAENTFMPQASGRLQQLLKKLKAGNVITDDEKATALNDFAEMSKVQNQPYKTYYFEQFTEYQDRVNGLYKEPVTVYPLISCEEYQQKIDEMKSLDKERVAAMQALKREDGRVMDGAKHDRLNQQRIEMLWDWKLYNDGAKAGACVITR